MGRRGSSKSIMDDEPLATRNAYDKDIWPAPEPLPPRSTPKKKSISNGTIYLPLCSL